MRALTRLAAGVALLLALAATLTAGGEGKKDSKAPKAKNAPAKFTHQSLLQALEKLGHEPRVYGKDKNTYELTVTFDGFRSVFSVYLSPDQTRLWITSNSRKLVDVAAIPPDVYVKLLAWNDSVAPFHFTLDETAKFVYLQTSLANEGITSEALNGLIDQMAGHIKRTWQDWKYEALQPAKPVIDSPAAAKARKTLLGTWTVHSLVKDGKTTTAESFAGYSYTFEGTLCRHGNATTKKVIPVALDAGKTPGHFDFRNDLSRTEKGIYKLEGDTLTLCIDGTGKDRPTTFEAKGPSVFVLTLKRQKAQ